jgi:hypothetical protein
MAKATKVAAIGKVISDLQSKYKGIIVPYEIRTLLNRTVEQLERAEKAVVKLKNFKVDKYEFVSPVKEEEPKKEVEA